MVLLEIVIENLLKDMYNQYNDINMACEILKTKFSGIKTDIAASEKYYTIIVSSLTSNKAINIIIIPIKNKKENN